MIKSILHLKIYEQESYESFFETFLLLYPTSCYQIVSQLMMEPNLSSLVILMLNMDLMSEDQEKTILVKWLSKLIFFFTDTGGRLRSAPQVCGAAPHPNGMWDCLPHVLPHFLPPSPSPTPRGDSLMMKFSSQFQLSPPLEHIEDRTSHV